MNCCWIVCRLKLPVGRTYHLKSGKFDECFPLQTGLCIHHFKNEAFAMLVGTINVGPHKMYIPQVSYNLPLPLQTAPVNVTTLRLVQTCSSASAEILHLVTTQKRPKSKQSTCTLTTTSINKCYKFSVYLMEVRWQTHTVFQMLHIYI